MAKYSKGLIKLTEGDLGFKFKLGTTTASTVDFQATDSSSNLLWKVDYIIRHATSGLEFKKVSVDLNNANPTNVEFYINVIVDSVTNKKLGVDDYELVIQISKGTVADAAVLEYETEYFKYDLKITKNIGE